MVVSISSFRLSHVMYVLPNSVISKVIALIFRICEETEQWTTSSEAQSCTLAEVEEKQAQFDQTMEQYVSKLAPPPAPPSPSD